MARMLLLEADIKYKLLRKEGEGSTLLRFHVSTTSALFQNAVNGLQRSSSLGDLNQLPRAG